MVKNKSGGSGHKKMGRKFVNAPKSNKLRLSQDDDEIYACVTKLLGNGMAHIINSNDTKMLLHIRNKFRGRSKRDNTLKCGTIILAGKRTFETVKEGKLEEDEGAFISAELTEPRILVTKSDGSYLYITTDLATVLLRNQEISHEKVLYVTDNRQKLHFKQLFQSIKFFDFPSKKYNHVGFGTINDSNGNPLKTRDGGNLKLVDLYQQTFKYIEEINNTLSDSDIHCLTNTVLTYSDLITNRKTDYKFDLEKFTNVSGKTGIYVQYAQVRANKLVKTLSKEKPFLPIPPTPLGSLDRKLIIALANVEFHLELSLKNNEPHHLANYLYTISNAFNAFYQDSNIKQIEDATERNQKIFITSLFIEYSHLVMTCLGITPVEKM